MERRKTNEIGQMQKIIYRLLRTVAAVIVSCTILLAGAMVLPRIFGFIPYAVMTGSMEPEIPVGAMIYVNTNSKEAQINDVIAFRLANGTAVTHRVVAIEDGKYITQGDMNNKEDIAPVSASQVLGIYVFHIPVIGYLFLVPAIKYLWLAITLSSMICLTILRKERKPSL